MSNTNFQPTTKRLADKKGLDFFPTPPWATHALLQYEYFKGDIWEPACGNGAMSSALKSTGNKVISSDLSDRGYGEAGVDFLEDTRRVPNIITNPPYNIAQKFVEHALELADNKVAMLLRLAFLESVGRANTLFADSPPSRIWVFSERVTFYVNGIKTGADGPTAHAWFVWDKNSVGETKLGWLKPGLKKGQLSLDLKKKANVVDEATLA